MGALSIRRCAVAEVLAQPNFEALVAEYAAESSLDGLPAPQPQWSTYEALERSGMAYPLAAFVDDVLVGFLVLVVSVNPHYGIPLGVTESFFVSPDARGTGAGDGLRSAAEHQAREVGAVALLVSAPFGGRLERVLPRHGYEQTNTVWMRRLA